MSSAAHHDPLHFPSVGTLHQNVDFNDYRKADGINASGLKEILRSPQHFQCYLNQPERTPTEAMRMGSIIHAAVLERSRFEFCKTVEPEVDRRTVKGREELAAWHAQKPEHAIVLQASDVPKIEGMLAAVDAHPILKKLLKGGKSETSILWQDPQHNVLCKARFDFVSEQAGGMIVDLKTCKDARPEAFAKDVLNFRYDLQAAHYLHAATVTQACSDKHFLWVVIEKESPYGINVFSASESVLSIGEQWRDEAMERYATALKSGVWPSYGTKVTTLEAPPWAALPKPREG